MSARNYGEPQSYPHDGSAEYDARGYVVVTPDGDSVRKHQSATAADYDGTNAVIGVNYVSSYDQDDVLQSVTDGEEIDVVTEGTAVPVRGEAEEFALGDTVYLSQSNDGRVNTSDSSSAALGTVVEHVDHSGGSATDPNQVLVSFDLN